ncbi:MAG: glycosyltransferase [Lachnospiraceae bacterium]|jgi:glycosyltransferase involved in cell wall biosynthesis|nr:glycosyltransferase [Lachnospiraceae bacterium]
MDDRVSISVITAAYNSSATIRQTIESVLNQTKPCLEYFIIDGASEDDTVSIAKEYQEEFKKRGTDYRIISEKDNGIYDAMNKGIALSSGTLVGLLNSDDWYEPVTVETVIQEYEKSPFDMIYADLRMIRNEKMIGIKKARLRNHYITTRDWNHPTTFITREMYEIYRYPCESVYDDLDLLLKIRKDGRKVAIVNKVLANYRLGGASNKKTWADARERMRLKYRIYRENGYSRFYILEAFAMETAKFILS